MINNPILYSAKIKKYKWCFKFNSDVKIIRQQRKIANGEVILKINEQWTNVIKFKQKISIFEYILSIDDLRKSKLGNINQINVLKKESEGSKNKKK